MCVCIYKVSIHIRAGNEFPSFFFFFVCVYLKIATHAKCVKTEFSLVHSSDCKFLSPPVIWKVFRRLMLIRLTLKEGFVEFMGVCVYTLLIYWSVLVFAFFSGFENVSRFGNILLEFFFFVSGIYGRRKVTIFKSWFFLIAMNFSGRFGSNALHFLLVYLSTLLSSTLTCTYPYEKCYVTLKVVPNVIYIYVYQLDSYRLTKSPSFQELFPLRIPFTFFIKHFYNTTTFYLWIEKKKIRTQEFAVGTKKLMNINHTNLNLKSSLFTK